MMLIGELYTIRSMTEFDTVKLEKQIAKLMIDDDVERK